MCAGTKKKKEMCSEMVKNRPKSSANYAQSMILLGFAMATLVGKMKYLFLFSIEETYDCFKEKFSHLNAKIYF